MQLKGNAGIQQLLLSKLAIKLLQLYYTFYSTIASQTYILSITT